MGSISRHAIYLTYHNLRRDRDPMISADCDARDLLPVHNSNIKLLLRGFKTFSLELHPASDYELKDGNSEAHYVTQLPTTGAMLV